MSSIKLRVNINSKILTFYILFILPFVSCNSKDSNVLNVYERTEKNYGYEIHLVSEKIKIPSDYLKSLIILESSGKINVPSRFENHVFNALVSLRAKKIKEYKKLKSHHVKDASDEALRNLASSWGPFQIMGYKCLGLGITVKDLRGDSAVYWGAVWINKEYGNYLRKNKFSEAFRIHNTGSPVGKTHHSQYVTNGLAHISYFKNRGN